MFTFQPDSLCSLGRRLLLKLSSSLPVFHFGLRACFGLHVVDVQLLRGELLVAVFTVHLCHLQKVEKTVFWNRGECGSRLSDQILNLSLCPIFQSICSVANSSEGLIFICKKINWSKLSLFSFASVVSEGTKFENIEEKSFLRALLLLRYCFDIVTKHIFSQISTIFVLELRPEIKIDHLSYPRFCPSSGREI